MAQFVFVLLFLSSSVLYPVISQPDYHVMMYVLQWPPTFCRILGNTCKTDAQQQFSIHGLWPANRQGESLKGGCAQPSVEDGIVENVLIADPNLEAALEKVWPNLKAYGENKDLWKHEWRTHGFLSRQTIQATGYFNAATKVYETMIAINNKMNLTEYLADANIIPSNVNVYTKKKITTALYKLVGNNNNVYISCKSNSGGVIFLHEIYLCLDKMLQHIVSCPTTKNLRGCKKGTKIILPTLTFKADASLNYAVNKEKSTL